MCVALIVGSGDVKAIGVPAEILVFVSLHTVRTPMYSTGPF